MTKRIECIFFYLIFINFLSQSNQFQICDKNNYKNKLYALELKNGKSLTNY